LAGLAKPPRYTIVGRADSGSFLRAARTEGAALGTTPTASKLKMRLTSAAPAAETATTASAFGNAQRSSASRTRPSRCSNARMSPSPAWKCSTTGRPRALTTTTAIALRYQLPRVAVWMCTTRLPGPQHHAASWNRLRAKVSRRFPLLALP